MTDFYPGSGVYAYQRKYKSQSILVFLNGMNKEVEVNLDQYQEVLEDGDNFVDIISGSEIKLNKSFTMSEKGILVLNLQSNGSLPDDDDQKENPKKQLSKGSVAAIVICTIIAVLAVGILTVFILKRSGKFQNIANEELIA